MATQRYRLEILSPLHIGSGQEYGVFDGVFQNGRWYLIDIEKVLTRSREDPTNLANAMMQSGFNWASWLQRRNIPPQEVAARAVVCHQNPAQTKIRACIRDPFGRPYIPGSTLKGAIRTAILEWLVLDLGEEKRRRLAQKVVQRDERGRLSPREWVGRETVERELLIGRGRGNESNRDLLRALHISDSEPIDPDKVQIGLVWVYTLRGNRLEQKRVGNEEYKMFLEWLPTSVETRLTITLDEGLLQGTAKADLGFSNQQKEALHGFIDACNKRASSLIESEQGFYKKDYGLSAIAQFYGRLHQRLNQVETQGGFLLNIGWGGGWKAKTVTNPLTEGLDEEFEQIRRLYKLGKRDTDVFPKTRRVAFRNNQPHAPLGWVALIPEGGTS
ncbi:hypothetical protein HRbin15_01374 [bacterium HR15]|nr:hypothetical protein HRbin15_01374 [bacterium HR15]